MRMKAPWSSRRAAADRSVSACVCECGYFCEYGGEYGAMYISSLLLRSSPSISVGERERAREERGRSGKKKNSEVARVERGTRLRKTPDQREIGGDQSACMPVCRSARARDHGAREAVRPRRRCEAKLMSVAPWYHRDLGIEGAKNDGRDKVSHVTAVRTCRKRSERSVRVRQAPRRSRAGDGREKAAEWERKAQRLQTTMLRRRTVRTCRQGVIHPVRTEEP